MSKFEVGKTYATRSICNYDCVISATVIGRTEKTIKADLGGHRGVKTFRVKPSYDGAESFLPWGRGSMMPIISATDSVEA